MSATRMASCSGPHSFSDHDARAAGWPRTRHRSDPRHSARFRRRPHCAGFDRRRQHGDRSALHRDQSDDRGFRASNCCLPATTPRASTAQGMSPQVTPQLHVDVGGTALTGIPSHDRRSTGESHRLGRARAGRNPAQRGLHAAGRTRGERFPAERTPLLRSGAVLAGRHAGSAQPDLFHQRRSFVRRHSRISEHLPRRRRRLQQRLLRAGPRTLSRALPVLDRSRAGVSRLLQLLRRRAGTLRRRRRQRRHQVRIESRARHGVLLPARQFVRRGRIPFWRSSRTTGSSRSEARSAVRSSATRFSSLPDSISTSFTYRTSSNSSTAVRKSCLQPATGPLLPGTTKLPIRRWSSRLPRKPDIAGRRISRRANRQLVLWQARHQSLAARSNFRCASTRRATGDRTTSSSIPPAHVTYDANQQ